MVFFIYLKFENLSALNKFAERLITFFLSLEQKAIQKSKPRKNNIKFKPVNK